MDMGRRLLAMGIVPLRREEVPHYTRILADSDMDGLFGAAVLKAFRPDATVMFSHAAALRGGLNDGDIDRNTVLVDLPFHPACGWYVDHHLTNRPDEQEASSFAADGGTQHWEATPSAARLAYELLVDITDMEHLTPMMPVVDALDSGGISKEAFLEDGPLLQLSRTCTSRDPVYMEHLVELLAGGADFEALMADPTVKERCQQAKEERTAVQHHVEANTTVVNRLAVCRMDESGFRSNGYLVTAGRVTELMLVASFTASQTAISMRPTARRSLRASTPIPSSQTVRAATICREWPRRSTQPVAVHECVWLSNSAPGFGGQHGALA